MKSFLNSFKRILKKRIFVKFDSSHFTLFYSFLIGLLFVGLYFYYHFSCQPNFFCRTHSLYQALYHWHQKYFDLKLLFRSKGEKTSNEIAIVAVDDASLSKVGRWPWDRTVTSKVIENIFRYKPKLLALDMVFSEPSKNSKSEMIQEIKKSNKTLSQSSVEEILSEIEKKDPDSILSQTLRKYSDRIVMGVFYEKEDTLETFAGMDEKVFPLDPRNLTQEKKIRDEKIWDKEKSFLSVFDPNPKMVSTTDLESKKNKSDFSLKDRDQFFKEKRLILNPVLKVSNWVQNISSFSLNTKNKGFFNAELEPDGVIRRSRLFVRTDSFYIPSLAFKAFLTAKNYNGELFFHSLKIGHRRKDIPFKDQTSSPEVFKKDHYKKNPLELEIKKGNRIFKTIEKLNVIDLQNGEFLFKIPVDDEGKILINYSSEDDFYTVSALEFLNQSREIKVKKEFRNKKNTFIRTEVYEKEEFLKDKILIFGVTAKAVFDMRATPVHKNYPGVKIHAHILNNLLQKNFLFSSLVEKKFSFGLLIFLTLFFGFCFHFLKAKKGLFLFLFSFFALTFLDFWLFFKNGLFSSSFFLITFLILEYGGVILIKYLIEESEMKQLKNTFSKYVSPLVFKEILSHRKEIQVKGKEEEVTLFFSDIRNFSELSEKMNPSFLNEWLSFYFNSMTEIILKNRGTLDKYIGDAILAFFGAPIQDRFHMRNACISALQQIEEMEEIKKIFLQKKWPLFNIGIALNSGKCYVGDTGSKKLRNYSVLGKAVNLTARIEELNKHYGTQILITKNIYQFVKEDFLCREIDFLKVRGKQAPLSIFELLSKKRLKNDLKLKDSKFNFSWIQNYNKAYEMFKKKDFENAKKYFLKTLDEKSNDSVSKIYIKRCDQYIKRPFLVKDSKISYPFKKS